MSNAPLSALAPTKDPSGRARRAAGFAAAVLVGLAGGVWAGTSVEDRSKPPEVTAKQAAAVLSTDLSSPRGLDLDGDGRLDLVLPVARRVRGVDAYGSGAFGAARDGGRRAHRGVDFVAPPGAAVQAPLSGVVTRVGSAYGGADPLRFIELVSPETGYTARILYVEPQVRPGDVLYAGALIGRAQDLSGRYPAGMTNHVHVEFTGRRGARLDPLVVLPELPAPPSTDLATRSRPSQARHG